MRQDQIEKYWIRPFFSHFFLLTLISQRKKSILPLLYFALKAVSKVPHTKKRSRRRQKSERILVSIEMRDSQIDGTTITIKSMEFSLPTCLSDISRIRSSLHQFLTNSQKRQRYRSQQCRLHLQIHNNSRHSFCVAIFFVSLFPLFSLNLLLTTLKKYTLAVALALQGYNYE